MTGKTKTIVLLPGDGIGPEVIGAAAGLLQECSRAFGLTFEMVEMPAGGCAIDRCGSPLPAETLDACQRADAVLLGAVGGPRWDALPIGQRPESGLLALRKGLGLYINLRPIRMRESLEEISPLKGERVENCDMEIVRELAGGIYFGEHRVEGANGSERAVDVEAYSTPEIERVARYAFERARKRGRKLASVDKANVLSTSQLWRKTVTRLGAGYPDVRLEHLLVDNAAMQLVIAPRQFDVIVTSNLFGDILSDAAAGLVGSIGLIPSMSCGTGTPLFEPIHGSAPSLAGKDCACPVGAILSVAMMLREAFGLGAEADAVEKAVERVLDRGYRTSDLAGPLSTVVSCSRFTAMVRAELEDSLVHVERYGWGV
ncbi:MAG: 3-isopropylmalate dehydrogenase [Acidobacteria bacterium]|nr:3-isopropylmalate dehydrogenase [Acidobacteriota bacterium]